MPFDDSASLPLMFFFAPQKNHVYTAISPFAPQEFSLLYTVVFPLCTTIISHVYCNFPRELSLYTADVPLCTTRTPLTPLARRSFRALSDVLLCASQVPPWCATLPRQAMHLLSTQGMARESVSLPCQMAGRVSLAGASIDGL